jgi:ryanodine receptor 2
MSDAPRPLDTSRVALSQDILRLTEQLARHAHEVWARERRRLGWTYGPVRDDARRQHPCLVPYDALPESEKQLDRNAALETLKAMLALGYRIEPPAPGGA